MKIKKEINILKLNERKKERKKKGFKMKGDDEEYVEENKTVRKPHRKRRKQKGKYLTKRSKRKNKFKKT